MNIKYFVNNASLFMLLNKTWNNNNYQKSLVLNVNILINNGSKIE